MQKSPSDLNSQAKILFNEGKVVDAIKNLKEALEIDPKFYEGWFNLGLIYQKIGRLESAIEAYEKNIEVYAPNAFAYKNLALCYSLIGNKEKALEIAKLVSGKDKNWESYFNLATTAQIAGQYDEAINYYKRVIKLNPTFGLTYGQLYSLYNRRFNWKEADKLQPQIEKINKLAIASGVNPAELPFGNIARVIDPKYNFEIAKIKATEIARQASEFKVRFSHETKGLKNNKKIRVGYLSSDFHDHATVHLISKMLKLHDKNKFEIIAYSHGVADDSEYRTKIVDSVDVFRDISFQNDHEAAAVIYNDVVDILVDLKGHTNGNRLGIMALKPAPISISWLGFPSTSGSDYINYILADEVVIPKNEQKYYSEKVLYMPNSYQVNDNTQEISSKKFKREDFGLPQDAFVFCSFNQAYKINQKTFESYLNILNKVPNSVLWLYEKDEIASKQLLKIAGSDLATRIVFAKNVAKDEHLARLKLADLALDTFTYNGHTTTSDCLWAGVPVVTLKGNHFASRVSASLLTAIGLPELITNSVKEYEKLAIDLAFDIKKLDKLKQKLQKNRLTKPLFDTEKFTRDLEAIYSRVFKKIIANG